MLATACPAVAEAKHRVLYLGADLELIKALRKVLKQPDYKLVTCSDGGSAILFLKSKIPYHSLLIDFDWAESQDWQLVRLARSLRHRKRMPIVLVATELSREVETLARKEGVNECMAKGSVSEEIGRAVGKNN